MLVETGKTYIARCGAVVGPLRPFSEKTDASSHCAKDLNGRSAWFVSEGGGSYDREGRWLTGGADCPLDLVCEYVPALSVDKTSTKLAQTVADAAAKVAPATASAAARRTSPVELTVGVWAETGLLFADVTVDGNEVDVRRAWLEPKGPVPAKIDVPLRALNILGINRGGVFRTFGALIADRARVEARA